MVNVYLNQIATAVPEHDLHKKFIDFAPRLLKDPRRRDLFERMVKRAQIEHRYSFLKPHPEKGKIDLDGFYQPGNFPDTQKRMEVYKQNAFHLAKRALDQLDFSKISSSITHLIITTCTGFYAPGLDLEIVNHYKLKSSVERTIIGFMGCYAAFNALKMASHIVRSEPNAKVAVLNLELCSLHLKETENLEELLSFLIFADGCAASIISSEPVGMELQKFYAEVLPNSSDQITWHIGGLGFDMVLSGRVPLTITNTLPSALARILDAKSIEDIRHWAIHPGGRSIIDAIQSCIGLPEPLLQTSRDVLRRFGNMSSASIMFVLKEMMESISGQGCAMAFGPGVTVESMLFRSV